MDSHAGSPASWGVGPPYEAHPDEAAACRGNAAAKGGGDQSYADVMKEEDLGGMELRSERDTQRRSGSMGTQDAGTTDDRTSPQANPGCARSAAGCPREVTVLGGAGVRRDRAGAATHGEPPTATMSTSGPHCAARSAVRYQLRVSLRPSSKLTVGT